MPVGKRILAVRATAKQMAKPTEVGPFRLFPGLELGGGLVPVLRLIAERLGLPKFAPISERRERFRTDFHMFSVCGVSFRRLPLLPCHSIGEEVNILCAKRISAFNRQTATAGNPRSAQVKFGFAQDYLAPAKMLFTGVGRQGSRGGQKDARFGTLSVSFKEWTSQAAQGNLLVQIALTD